MATGFRILAILFFMVAVDASATTPVAVDYNKMDEAELCDSFDGRHRVVRLFSNPLSFFVALGANPGGEPDVKEGYSHVQEAGGTLYRAPVSLDIFELMAEPFGETQKPKAQWKSAFEKVFVGNISVYDATGTLLISFKGQCNSAVVEFK